MLCIILEDCETLVAMSSRVSEVDYLQLEENKTNQKRNITKTKRNIYSVALHVTRTALLWK